MIRTLICDLGNVLFFFSHEKMYAQLGALFGVNGSQMKHAFAANGWLREYETGRLTTHRLRDQMLAAFTASDGPPLEPPDDETLLRASADIFQPNEEMIDLVTRLKQSGLRLVMLSNTSDAHRIWIDRHSDIMQRFDALVLSYEVGYVKPEDGIYAAAQAEAHCRPDECFYIDDIPEYVAAGRRHGWHAEVYRTTPTIVDRLRSLGVEVPRHS
jgi:putative hydrolase of the HAD superfamily